jgi:hypothetical protein
MKFSDILLGVTPKKFRTLSFCVLIRNDTMLPPSWVEKGKGGADLFPNFLERHKDLSLRPPERTSLARLVSFNKENVKQFYGRVSELHSRHRLGASEIRSVGETGMTAVMKPEEIIAERGSNCEQGKVGRTNNCGSGSQRPGHLRPQMLIFPRKPICDHFIRDGPAGYMGAATGPDWINEELFVHII